MEKYQKIPLIAMGFLLAILFSILVDQILGIYLKEKGYFKAIAPNVIDIFQTSEFSVSAHSSSQGLRNEMVKLPKPKEVYRILVLGDSFTYGWGGRLEGSWPKQLQNLLKIPGRQVEVVNAGVPGAGPNEYLKICQAYTDYLQADAVILGFFSTNDLYQAVESKEKSLWPTLQSVSHPIITSWHFDAIPGDTFYLSEIWQKQAEKIIQDHPDLESKLNPEVFRQLQMGKLNPAVIIPALSDPKYLIRFLDKENFNFEIAAMDKILAKIKTECIGKRIGVLIFIPSYELVSEDYFKYRINQGYIVDKKLTSFDLDTPLREISEENGFKYISILSEFRKDKCIGCYYPLDSHMTPLGQKRVAEAVAGIILFGVENK